MEEEVTTLPFSIIEWSGFASVTKRNYIYSLFLFFFPLDSDNSEISKSHKFISGRASLLFSVLNLFFCVLSCLKNPSCFSNAR